MRIDYFISTLLFTTLLVDIPAKCLGSNDNVVQVRTLLNQAEAEESYNFAPIIEGDLQNNITISCVKNCTSQDGTGTQGFWMIKFPDVTHVHDTQLHFDQYSLTNRYSLREDECTGDNQYFHITFMDIAEQLNHTKLLCGVRVDPEVIARDSYVLLIRNPECGSIPSSRRPGEGGLVDENSTDATVSTDTCSCMTTNCDNGLMIAVLVLTCFIIALLSVNTLFVIVWGFIKLYNSDRPPSRSNQVSHGNIP